MKALTNYFPFFLLVFVAVIVVVVVESLKGLNSSGHELFGGGVINVTMTRFYWPFNSP